MPIGIQEPVIAANAYIIDQKWTVRSVKHRRIGTDRLANCLGLVVHSPNAGIGCLAHIEAEGATYAATFNTFLLYMISKIRKYAPRGVVPTLQLALFGNAQGSQDAAFTAAIRLHIIAAGVPAADILDQRNHPPGGGPFYDAGALPRSANFFGAITYAPAVGDGLVLCFGPFGAQPAHASSIIDWGIRKRKLQA
jgi:hypothetical protein